jgi:hypothetical protein
MSDEMVAGRKHVAAAQSRVLPRRDPRSARRTTIVIGVIVAIVGLGIILQFFPVIGSTIGGPAVNIGPESVNAVALDRTPDGLAVSFVLTGQGSGDTTMTGTVAVEVREPDGATWTAARSVTPASFQPLPAGSPLAGRVGHRIVVPDADWLRPPRRGGLGSVVITATPDNGAPLTSTASVYFP